MTILTVLIISCSQQTVNDGVAAVNDKRLSTSTPSALYFKNMRSIYYQSAPQVQGIDLFAFKRVLEESSELSVIPVIGNNWLRDEAYIWFFDNFEEKTLHTNLRIEYDGPDGKGVLELKGDDAISHYEFAKSWFDLMKNHHTFRIQNEASTQNDLFKDANIKSHFSIIFSDYFRLTDKNGI